jgi:hypothetical protein
VRPLDQELLPGLKGTEGGLDPDRGRDLVQEVFSLYVHLELALDLQRRLVVPLPVLLCQVRLRVVQHHHVLQLRPPLPEEVLLLHLYITNPLSSYQR